jgi:hypothetical protein
MKRLRCRIPSRALIALFLASMVGFVLFGATVWASQNSLPGGTLYGVKRLTEDAQRIFVSSKLQRAELELEFAARRLGELEGCRSGICRLEAAVALDAALTKAALAVALAPSGEREALENQLMNLAGEGEAWLQQKIDQLTKTALSQRPRLSAQTSRADGDPEDPESRLDEAIVQLAALTQAEIVADTETRPALFPTKTPTSHPFPRDGAHADATCEDCHGGGVDKETPRTCADCHEDPHKGANGLVCQSCHTVESFSQAEMDHTGLVDCESCHSETAPLDHFSGQCSQCHVAGGSWIDASFNHSGYTDCQSCHTRPDGHFSGQCSECHVAGGSWLNASFNHSGYTDCQSCHTRPDGHFSGQCSQCHVAGGSWLNASFNHSGYTDCQSCHTRPDGHFSGQCSQCHVAGGSWRDASFDHSGYTDCQNCHTRPDGHSSGQCSQCHTTSSWAGAGIGNHGFPLNHGGAGGNCSTCHAGNNYATYTCFSCHNQNETIKEHEQGGSGDFASCARCHGGGGGGDGDRDDDGEREGDHDDDGDRGGDDDDRGDDDEGKGEDDGGRGEDGEDHDDDDKEDRGGDDDDEGGDDEDRGDDGEDGDDDD